MTEAVAIVTGSNGGIGQAIVAALQSEGWFVVGIDLTLDENSRCDAFVPFDLAQSADHQKLKEDCVAPIMESIGARPIKALVNNAAVQILGATADIEQEDWNQSLAVNLSAPFFLSQALLPALKKQKGAILNIGSVHAQATKKEFVSYATSKTALHGLTRAMAVDLGGEVRVNCLAPAAIKTDMLKAGFEGNETAFDELKSVHPAGRIGSPEEVAKAVCFMLDDETPFLTGSCFYLDGGILSRLHDPV